MTVGPPPLKKIGRLIVYGHEPRNKHGDKPGVMRPKRSDGKTCTARYLEGNPARAAQGRHELSMSAALSMILRIHSIEQRAVIMTCRQEAELKVFGG